MSCLPTAGAGQRVEGRAPAHFGELIQGQFTTRLGRRPALVTLPCVARRASASFSWTGADLTVQPAGKKKCLEAARRVLEVFGVPARGELVVHSEIKEGIGMGSSTSEMLAVIRAVSLAIGRSLLPETEARLVYEVEGAADPLMYPDRLTLYGHKDCAIIEDFSVLAPEFWVLGFDTAPQGNGIDTASVGPPDYSDADVRKFDRLRRDLREALETGSIAAIGKVSTESARINQRTVPKPSFDEFVRKGREHGAAGVAVAHTGTVAGWILDPDDVRWEEVLEGGAAVARELGYESLLLFRCGRSVAGAA